MSTLSELPYVLLDVAENIIDQLSRDVESLRSCSLTCRGWLPRARYHLVASIRVRSREDLYSICDYFRVNPGMANCVRNLSVSPAYSEKNPLSLMETIPVALLSRLPKLRSYGLQESLSMFSSNDDPILSFHRTTLIHIRTYLHVEELTLGPLNFRAYAEFARLLIALPRLRRLDCTELRFLDKGKPTGGDATGITRFRDKCKCLSNVMIEGSDVLAVRLIIQMSLSSLEFLRFDSGLVMASAKDGDIGLDLSEFKHLQSLEIITEENTGSWIAGVTDGIIQILSTALPSTLRYLTMTFTSRADSRDLAQTWSDRTVVQRCESLEDVIIWLGTLPLVVWIPQAKRNRLAFWSKLICSCFPRLHERRLLQVQCSSVNADGQGRLGHDASVTAAAASPDGRYIATSAADGTIIIWSEMPFAQTVLVEIQCPAQNGLINTLAFSDTGEFLAAANDSDLLVYRVADGSLVTSVEVGGPALSCAWRSDGPHHDILSVLGYTANRSTSRSIVRVRLQRPGDPKFHAVSCPAPFFCLEEAVMDDSESAGFLHWQLSPSGRTVASTSTKVVKPSRKIWRMVDEESAPAYEVHNLTHSRTEPWDPVAPSCASLVGDDQLVVGFSDGTLRWWDISMFPLATTEPRGVLRLPLYYRPVVSLLVSPHRTFLMAYSNVGETAWVLRRGGDFGRRAQGGLRDVTELSLHVSLQDHTGPIRAACFSHCERYVATASGDTVVRLWSVGDGSLLWTFVDHDMEVTHVVFSADGKTLVSADKFGRVCAHALSMFVRDAPLC